MREGWEEKSISEVSEIISGGTPKTSIKEYWTGGVAWITPADMGKLKSVEVAKTRREISKLGLDKSSAKLFPENSVILSTRAPIGHLAINTIPMSTNQGCRGLVPGPELETDFLYYFLLGNIRLLNDLGTGTTFKELSKTALGSVKINIPPIEKQKEIVSILDDAFASIDKAKANIERNIENAKELFQSKLNEIFSQTGKGWENLKIIDLCSHKSQIVGGPFGSNLKVIDYKESGVPILRLQNIGKGFFIDKAIKFISKEKAEELAYHSFKSGDIVLAKLGIPIGKTCIVPSTFEYGIVVADVVRIRPNKEKITYTFLKHFLNSDCSVNQLSSEITGSTRPRVNIAEVRNLKISVPSLSKQKNVAGLIDDFENLRNLQIGVYEKELANLEELKKSILQKAFSGELTNKSVAA
jgi:type I restriction enzyme S subunit